MIEFSKVSANNECFLKDSNTKNERGIIDINDNSCYLEGIYSMAEVEQILTKMKELRGQT